MGQWLSPVPNQQFFNHNLGSSFATRTPEIGPLNRASWQRVSNLKPFSELRRQVTAFVFSCTTVNGCCWTNLIYTLLLHFWPDLYFCCRFCVLFSQTRDLVMKRERQEKNFLRRKRNRINKVGRWPNNGFGLSHSPLNRLQYSHDGIWLGNFGLKKNEALQSDKAGCCIRLYPQEHISWKVI